MREILPCPFCGAWPEICQGQDPDGKLYDAVAWFCCMGGVRVPLSVWNRRVPSAAVARAMEKLEAIARRRVNVHSSTPSTGATLVNKELAEALAELDAARKAV